MACVFRQPICAWRFLIFSFVRLLSAIAPALSVSLTAALLLVMAPVSAQTVERYIDSNAMDRNVSALGQIAMPVKDSLRLKKTLLHRADSFPIPKNVRVPGKREDTTRISLFSSGALRVKGLLAEQRSLLQTDIDTSKPVNSSWHLKPPQKEVLSYPDNWQRARKSAEGVLGKLVRLKTQPPPIMDSAGIKENVPAIRINGGYVNYLYEYRSSVDTPFAEKNIGQHTVSGGFSSVIAGALPLTINFWLRRSNSILYNDITDVQVSFDANQYKNLLLQRFYARLLNSPSLKDSLLEKLLAAKLAEFTNAKDFTTKPATIQQLHESHEIIAQDDLQKRDRAADSAVIGLSKDKVETARWFLELFEKTQKQADSLSGIVDSLKHLVTLQRTRIAQLRGIASSRSGNGIAGYTASQPPNTEVNDSLLPAKYQWLMGIRNASVGRTPVNYSALTARNISITGINLEYNSWYYLAVAAGAIDYRFRDAVVNRTARKPQFMYLLRAGFGRLERNFFIVSFFKGSKQLYNFNTQPRLLSVAGITAETKWQLTPHTYITAEAGQSAAPNLRSGIIQAGIKSSSTNDNRAWSVKAYTSFPKIAARAEGAYKYTGANYQSFNPYQNSAAASSWYVKWEQYFLHKKLRITGSLRSNEFTNPYLVQSYKANTLFKSIQASFRSRWLPVLTMGYMPMSQLSVVGQQVVENRFQTLTGSIYHHYKIGNRQAFSMLVYNKFYNTPTDSSFVYFNTQNLYFTQTIFYRLFTAGIAITDSRNNQYHLMAAELNLRVPVLRQTVAVMAVKIISLDQRAVKTGGRFSIESAISNRDRVSIAFEKVYLPGIGKGLTNNDMGTVQYSRYF